MFIIIPIISTTYTFYLIRVIKNNQKVVNDDNVMKKLYFTQFIKALCTTHTVCSYTCLIQGTFMQKCKKKKVYILH